MSKEELIKILQDDSTIVTELNANNAYIVQVEIGGMPKELVKRYIDNLTNKLKEIGLEKIIIIPTDNGLGELIFREVKQDE